MNSSRSSCCLDESIISLPSASSLSFDAVGREADCDLDLPSQSHACDLTLDLTLTSFEEDEDLDETLSDASSVDYTIAYHSGTLASEVEELLREHHRQQYSRQGSQKHSIVPTTSNRFHPLKHSTPQKSSNHVRNMDQ